MYSVSLDRDARGPYVAQDNEIGPATRQRPGPRQQEEALMQAHRTGTVNVPALLADPVRNAALTLYKRQSTESAIEADGTQPAAALVALLDQLGWDQPDLERDLKLVGDTRMMRTVCEWAGHRLRAELEHQIAQVSADDLRHYAGLLKGVALLPARTVEAGSARSAGAAWPRDEWPKFVEAAVQYPSRRRTEALEAVDEARAWRSEAAALPDGDELKADLGSDASDLELWARLHWSPLRYLLDGYFGPTAVELAEHGGALSADEVTA